MCTSLLTCTCKATAALGAARASSSGAFQFKHIENAVAHLNNLARPSQALASYFCYTVRCWFLSSLVPSTETGKIYYCSSGCSQSWWCILCGKHSCLGFLVTFQVLPCNSVCAVYPRFTCTLNEKETEMSFLIYRMEETAFKDTCR